MMKISIVVLIASLMLAYGTLIASFATWGELAQPAGIGGLLGIGGSVVLAWLGKSPIRPK